MRGWGMSAPIVLRVGRVTIDLRQGYAGWYATRIQAGAPESVHRWHVLTRRADAEAVCVAWALEVLDALDGAP